MRFNLLSSIRRPGARAALAAAVGVAALAAVGAAQAGGNVYWSVGVAAPGVQVGVANAPPVYAAAPVYVQPAPVYVRPAPVWVQPAPVYYRAPRVVVPAPVVYRPVARGWAWGHRHHPHGPRPVPYAYGPRGNWVGPAAETGYGP